MHVQVNVDRMVYYGGWIGRIEDYWERVKLRLSDGSVIQLDDAEDVLTMDGQPVSDVLVGDLLKTKKANLRQGRVIFGQHNSNVSALSSN